MDLHLHWQLASSYFHQYPSQTLATNQDCGKGKFHRFFFFEFSRDYNLLIKRIVMRVLLSRVHHHSNCRDRRNGRARENLKCILQCFKNCLLGCYRLSKKNNRTVPVEYLFQMSGVFPFGSLDDNLKRFKIIVTRIWWVVVNDPTWTASGKILQWSR